MENISIYIEYITLTIEAIGVLAIFIGLIYSLFIFFKRRKDADRFSTLRQTLGKSILLGLEILIAADIIATVSTAPTLRSVVVLGLIVLIRTFLSMSIEIELEGKLPWQQKKKAE